MNNDKESKARLAMLAGLGFKGIFDCKRFLLSEINDHDLTRSNKHYTTILSVFSDAIEQE